MIETLVLKELFFCKIPINYYSNFFFINKFRVKLEKYYFTDDCNFNNMSRYIFSKNTLINIFGFEAVLQGSVYRLGGFMNDELKISNIIFNFGALVFCYFFQKFYK